MKCLVIQATLGIVVRQINYLMGLNNVAKNQPITNRYERYYGFN